MGVKDELRYKLKIKRKYFCGVQREYADYAAMENFMAAYGGFESFFIYNSFSTEASTKLIIEKLKESGKRVYLPKVVGENIVPVALSDKLTVGAFGIPEPLGQPYSGDIDVTVAPLLAVNGKGYRIGYGKGFYDRYFKNAKTLKVGLGYGFQLEEFECDEWDEPLDEYVCERGIYRFGKSERS